MPKLPDPPDTNTTFERMKGESPLAWDAFVRYRNMGPSRTIQAVVKDLGKPNKYLSTLLVWSAKWSWGQRCMKWDALVDAKTREAAFDRLPLWEARRQEALERNMEAAATLRARLLEMTAHPLTYETRRDSDGGEVTVIMPAKWNWNAVVAGFKMVAEMEAATIAEGLLEADDESFDPETATPEQLKAFINKHRRRKSGSNPGSLGL